MTIHNCQNSVVEIWSKFVPDDLIVQNTDTDLAQGTRFSLRWHVVSLRGNNYNLQAHDWVLSNNQYVRVKP